MSQRYVPKLRDRDLVNAFRRVFEDFSSIGPRLKFSNVFGKEFADDLLDQVIELNGFEIRTVEFSVGNCLWTLTRHENPQEFDIDHLDVTVDGRPPGHGYFPGDMSAFYAVSAIIAEMLSRPLASAPDTPEKSRLQSHQIILGELESVASKLIIDTEAHRRRLDEEHDRKERRRQERLEETLAEIKRTSEEERQKLEEDVSRRQSLLDEREAGLDALKKQLDDRNNTHVRREIRSSLLQLAKDRLENFNISTTTRKQYVAVNIASIAGFLCLASASAYFGSQISFDSQTKKYTAEAIALIVKSGSFAAAAIALGSWYLGWLNRWLQRIADTEFRLQQFRLDIERASWLAETVLEWKASSHEPFPELLASRLSSGLFQSSGTDADGPRTPASHLAEALLGSASSAKLRMGDSELNFDRKGIQRLDE